ncbi:hypothetical protein EDB84DRAFT_1633958 [Lactarius hengduanensis]|nr:hypothetical protein EDB84DRAFT_1633958 [Lactarius hengduanensis]
MGGWYLVAVVVAVEAAAVEGDGTDGRSWAQCRRWRGLRVSRWGQASGVACACARREGSVLRQSKKENKKGLIYYEARAVRRWGGLCPSRLALPYLPVCLRFAVMWKEEVEEGAESRGRLKFEQVAPPGQVAYFPTPQIKLQPGSRPVLEHHFLSKSI